MKPFLLIFKHHRYEAYGYNGRLICHRPSKIAILWQLAKYGDFVRVQAWSRIGRTIRDLARV